MRLEEFNSWYNETTITHWSNDEIYEKYYVNGELLKSEVLLSLNNMVKNEVILYYGSVGGLLSSFKDVLPSMYGYIVGAYLTTVLDRNCPAVINLFPNTTFLGLFESFNVNLENIDYTGWFTIEEVLEPDLLTPESEWIEKEITEIIDDVEVTHTIMVPPESFQGTGLLIVNEEINSLKDRLLNSVAGTSSFFTNFNYQIWPATRDRTIFNMFQRPDITMSDINPKEFMLVNMGLSQILTDMGWNIAGLN